MIDKINLKAKIQITKKQNNLFLKKYLHLLKALFKDLNKKKKANR